MPHCNKDLTAEDTILLLSLEDERSLQARLFHCHSELHVGRFLNLDQVTHGQVSPVEWRVEWLEIVLGEGGGGQGRPGVGAVEAAVEEDGLAPG